MKESIGSFQRLVNIRFRQWQIKYGETNIGDWKEQNKRRLKPFSTQTPNSEPIPKKPRESQAGYTKRYLESLTPEQREERKAKARMYQQKHRESLSPEQLEAKRERARQLAAERIAKRTPEQQAAHLAKLAERKREYYAKDKQ
jgi:transglutaminase-like putative cysteine protease